MKTQFLIVWAVTIFVTYQFMATKYMTYTFPYMIPIAIGFASYLKKYDRLVVNMAGIVLAIYVAVTYMVIIPQCQQPRRTASPRLSAPCRRSDDSRHVRRPLLRVPDLLLRPSGLSPG